MVSAHTGLRCYIVGFDPRGRRGNILVSEQAVLVSFAGMTLNKFAILWIGTLTGGPVHGESPLCWLKSHIYKVIPEHQYVVVPTSVSFTEKTAFIFWSGNPKHTYILRCHLQKRRHLLKMKNTYLPYLTFWSANPKHIFFIWPY